jgi:hypothetical protein
MRRTLSAVPLLVAIVLLAGCGGGSPATLPTVAGPPNGPGASTTADQTPGAAACALLSAAVDAASLMEPGVVDAIAVASRTAGAPVDAAGGKLVAAYGAAVASRGTDGEPDAVAAVSAAGADMKTVCVDAGLETAG